LRGGPGLRARGGVVKREEETEPAQVLRVGREVGEQKRKGSSRGGIVTSEERLKICQKPATWPYWRLFYTAHGRDRKGEKNGNEKKKLPPRHAKPKKGKLHGTGFRGWNLTALSGKGKGEKKAEGPG